MTAQVTRPLQVAEAVTNHQWLIHLATLSHKSIKPKPPRNRDFVLVVCGDPSCAGSVFAGLRNWIYRVVEKQVAASGRVSIRCFDSNDPLQKISTWKGFHATQFGSSNFNDSDLVIKCSALWELGDHADDSIAQVSATRKKSIPIEDHFDDCGLDTSSIDLPHESSFACDMPDLEQESEDEEQTFDSVFLSWYMRGSDVCADNTFVQSVPTFTEAYTVLHKHFRSGRVHDYVELFGGDGGCSRAAIRRHLVGGGNLDLVTGIDLSKASEVSSFFKYLRRCRPTVVIMTPPCTAFGPWSHYNSKHHRETWLQSLALGKPLAEFCARVALFQMSHRRHFLCENPRQSNLWSLPVWKAVMQDVRISIAYVDQCMFGLCSSDNKLHKKPTAFVASHYALVNLLRRKCDGSHQHDQIAGSLHGISKAKFAQVWPARLCEAIIQGIINLIRLRARDSYCAAYPITVVCPGCKSHAARGMSSHNRGPGCKFPYDTSEVWTCPMCNANKHVHHQGHSRIVGECRWATAGARATSSRTGDPRVPASSVVEAPEEEETLLLPPATSHGDWQPVVSLSVCAVLDSICNDDGWHKLESGVAFVAHDARDLRSTEPRFALADFPTRSSYAFLHDHVHAHGNWWSMQENVACTRQRLEFPVDILIQFYHPTGVVSEPVKIKPDEGLGNPIRDALQSWSDSDEEISTAIKPFVPAEPKEAGELEVLPLTLDAKPSDESNIAVPDWSSWNLGKALRTLRGTSQAQIIRTIRQLHLRWWHASASRMESLLTHAGLPKEVVVLVKSVCDTCRICRLWRRPGPSAVATSRLSTEFNDTVQVDLLFWHESIVLHMLDTCIKWSAAALVEGKKPSDLLPVMAKIWFRVYGAPKVLVSDHEGALCGEESSIWLERWGVSLIPKPVGSHAYQVERHNALLRHQLDSVKAQVTLEGLSVSDDDILSESLFAKNTMLQIRGTSPYKALLGRVPEILKEFETPGLSMISDGLGGDTSRHATRLREISIQQIIEGTAQDRLKRAAHTQTRVSGQLLDLVPGMAVDIFREPRSKDLSGWRGPAEVISTHNITDGYIDCKWAGRALSVRVADIRKSLVYVQLLDSSEPQLQIVLQHLHNIHDSYQTLAFVHGPHGWTLSQGARQFPEVFRAGMFVGFNVFHLRAGGVRLGRGVATLQGLFGSDVCVLMWFPVSQPTQYQTIQFVGTQVVNLKQLLGESWLECCWIQFLGIKADVGRYLKELLPDEPFVGDNPHQDPDVPMPPAPGVVNDAHMSSSDSDPDDPMHPQPWPPRPPQPPRPPPPLRPPRPSMPIRQPVVSNNSMRSRSDVSTRHPVPTDVSTSSSALPPGWSHVSRKIPGVVPKSAARSNKTQHGGAQASTWQRPVAPLPQPVEPMHHPIHTQDEDMDSLGSTMPVDTDNEEDDMFYGHAAKVPPTPFADNSSGQHLEQCVHEQLAYLASFSVAEGPYALGAWQESSDDIEIEVSPEMSRFFEDAPPVAADEVLVFVIKKGGKGKVKRMVQKNLDNLTAQDVRDNWSLVEAAIRKEIKSFVDLETFEPIKRFLAENVCSSRWVHKFKLVDGTRIVKSRLTIRGFEDLATEVNTFASTASRWGQRIILSVCVQRAWVLFCWDVSSAFLQGLTFKEVAAMSSAPMRVVCFAPPIGSERYFVEVLGSKYNPMVHVLKALKGIYGLRDAPRLWKNKLHLVLVETGGRLLHTDGSLYAWFESGSLCMLLSTHVDDLKGGGETKIVARVRAHLELNFGTLKVQLKSFEHCGIIHTQSEDNCKIQVHQNHYVKQLQLMNVTALALGPQNKPLSVPETADFLSLLGGLSWTIQTRTDIAIYVCALQRSAKAPCAEHAVRINKVLKWARRKDSFVTYLWMPPPCRILSISDSAFRKEDVVGLAMRGAIIGIASCSDIFVRSAARYRILRP